MGCIDSHYWLSHKYILPDILQRAVVPMSRVDGRYWMAKTWRRDFPAPHQHQTKSYFYFCSVYNSLGEASLIAYVQAFSLIWYYVIPVTVQHLFCLLRFLFCSSSSSFNISFLRFSTFHCFFSWYYNFYLILYMYYLLISFVKYTSDECRPICNN